MECKWRDTGYRRTLNGAKVYECARFPACNQIAFLPDGVDPKTAHADCAAPKFELGTGVETALTQWGVTPARWIWFKQKVHDLLHTGVTVQGCGCEKRKRRLNELLTVPLPYWAYLLRVALGKSQPRSSKIEKLLEQGKIR